jgi:hypothetical protein
LIHRDGPGNRAVSLYWQTMAQGNVEIIRDQYAAVNERDWDP